MNSKDFRKLFLYERKSKHNDAAAPRNINAAFGNCSVNDLTTFDTGMQILKLGMRISQKPGLLWTKKFYEQ